MAFCTTEPWVGVEEETQLLKAPSILMVKLTKSQSWWWRWRKAANCRRSFLQGKGNLALSAAFHWVRILSLSFQTFSEPTAMLIFCKVLSGTSCDSCSLLYVVLGHKRRDEMVVTIPFGESSSQKDCGCGESSNSPPSSASSTLLLSASRLPGGSPSSGCLRALANVRASFGRIRLTALSALCRNACTVLTCSYPEPKLLGSFRSHALQAGQTQLT